MTALILAVLSAVLLVLGVPIFIVLLTAAVIGVWLTGNPIQAVHSAMFGSLDIFPLLAVPLFIYAGDVMSRGGMARRLIEFVLSIFGAVRGSLGIATIAACELFSVLSGSAVACVAAIGKLTIPALKQNGYGERFSVSLVTATGVIDIIIPPSITMIIYGIVAQQSVPQLFLAGFVPGILIGSVLMAYVMAYARVKRIPITEPARWRQHRGRLEGVDLGAAGAGRYPRRHLWRLVHADRSGRGCLHLCHRHLDVRVPRDQLAPAVADHGRLGGADRANHDHRLGRRRLRLADHHQRAPDASSSNSWAASASRNGRCCS